MTKIIVISTFTNAGFSAVGDPLPLASEIPVYSVKHIKTCFLLDYCEVKVGGAPSLREE
jgi:hypothetical protein